MMAERTGIAAFRLRLRLPQRLVGLASKKMSWLFARVPRNQLKVEKHEVVLRVVMLWVTGLTITLHEYRVARHCQRLSVARISRQLDWIGNFGHGVHGHPRHRHARTQLVSRQRRCTCPHPRAIHHKLNFVAKRVNEREHFLVDVYPPNVMLGAGGRSRQEATAIS